MHMLHIHLHSLYALIKNQSCFPNRCFTGEKYMKTCSFFDHSSFHSFQGYVYNYRMITKCTYAAYTLSNTECNHVSYTPILSLFHEYDVSYLSLFYEWVSIRDKSNVYVYMC